MSECKFTIIFLSSLLFGVFFDGSKILLLITFCSSNNNKLKRQKRKEGENHRKKNHIRNGFVCRSSRRRRRQGYENLYTGFLLTFLPSFVFLRVTRFTDVLSLSFFYFRTHRREDFQDEVRAVPRRRTGGRTQTGTRVCFRRHLFSDRLWSV